MAWLTTPEVRRSFSSLRALATIGAPAMVAAIDQGEALALALLETTPPCADQSAAIRELRSALLWGLAAAMRPTKPET